MTTRKIHLMGIGGVGMAGLALLLKSRGHTVAGCDLHASPRTRWLEANGIPVAVGHDPSHLAGVDELIVTPAVPGDAPELARARRPGSGVAVRYRGEVLAELVNAGESIAVCGSHGKTTTATWIARLLKALGEDVAWCIGGETGAFPVAGTGSGPLVVEADESDGTLALYRAKTLVVNRCEYDHPDHFKTPADYFACYEQAKGQAGTVIDSERLEDLTGLDCLADLPLHNWKNARAAVEVALRRGHALSAVAAVLPDIVRELPDRRFQVLCTSAADGGSPAVVTDYAHHPTEMACAVGMARERCRGTLRVLFQPHRYSRTKALLDDFPAVFAGADEVVLCPTYAAFERPVPGGDIADLYRVCRAASVPVRLARSCAEAWEHACRSMADGDLTLLLGAGDIIGLASRVSADLHDPARLTRPPRRIWIGAGSNTWKSDLNLNVAYVRTDGPAGKPGASLGIPWMVGIPGTVGGWVRMNAGAHGHSLSEVIARVKVDGVWRTASDCGFSYRHSAIDGEIQDVEWDETALAAARGDGTAEAYLAKRRKFPAHTWGSFFKNPPGDAAGRLLEAAGAKALRVGGAFVWQEHANVIVAPPSEATPSDVLALARLMHQSVFHAFGISLEPEVCGIVI